MILPVTLNFEVFSCSPGNSLAGLLLLLCSGAHLHGFFPGAALNSKWVYQLFHTSISYVFRKEGSDNDNLLGNHFDPPGNPNRAFFFYRLFGLRKLCEETFWDFGTDVIPAGTGFWRDQSAALPDRCFLMRCHRWSMASATRRHIRKFKNYYSSQNKIKNWNN